jgi:hypothetical protein
LLTPRRGGRTPAGHSPFSVALVCRASSRSTLGARPGVRSLSRGGTSLVTARCSGRQGSGRRGIGTAGAGSERTHTLLRDPWPPTRQAHDRAHHNERSRNPPEDSQPGPVSAKRERSDPWKGGATPTPDRDCEERPYDSRVELRAGQPGKLCASGVMRDRSPVGLDARHDVISVHHRDYLTSERDRVSCHAGETPGTVVVRGYGRRSVA